MTALYVLDVPENAPIAQVAQADPAVTVGRVGPYVVLSAPGDITIDRRATGCRHAVWYSSIAATSAARIVQWDRDALRAVPT